MRIKKNIINSLILGGIVGAVSIVFSTFYNLYEYRELRLLYKNLNKKKFYVYNTYNFDDGYVFPLIDIENKELYKKYYELQEKNIKPEFDINKNVLLALKGVFAAQELADEKIITIYTIDTICWSVNKNFVYYKLISEDLPSNDSLRRRIINVDSLSGNKCTDFEPYNSLKKLVY